jgi:hypothetical protein
MSERVYCAEAEPREPLAGTADPVDVWILIEYRPTWRARAHDDNELPPEFRAWLAAGSAALGAQGLRARPQGSSSMISRIIQICRVLIW